jgi:SAM-dependent methyltransferase
MNAKLVKSLVRELCPASLWRAARGCYRRVVAPPYRVFTSLAEVDAELERLHPLHDVCYDAFSQGLEGFRLAPPTSLPTDPHSAEYRDAQMALYLGVSGRSSYVAQQCEQVELGQDYERRPFPYFTRSCSIIGGQLMAIGFVIRALGLPAGGRVLEFGSGYGRLTVEMLRSDFRVTAVDVNRRCVEMLAAQCRRDGLEAELVCSGMLDYRPAGRFDRVVFYESFHHCDDHQAMVRRLDEMVADGGAVLFAGEPIHDVFPMPWGLRLDGQSLWAIRKNGWLELGFRTDYFLDLLERHGWTAEVLPLADVAGMHVFVARRR